MLRLLLKAVGAALAVVAAAWVARIAWEAFSDPDKAAQLFDRLNHAVLGLITLCGTLTLLGLAVVNGFSKIAKTLSDVKREIQAGATDRQEMKAELKKNTELCDETGKKMESTAQAVKEVARAVNGHTDRLVEATSRAAKAEGRAEGKAEVLESVSPAKVVAEAAKVAAEVVVKAKSVADSLEASRRPVSVTIDNQLPIPVHETKPPEGKP